MSDLKKKLLGSSLILFNDSFSSQFIPAAWGTLYPNAINGWSVNTYRSGSGYSQEIPNFTGSYFHLGRSNYHYLASRIHRTNEGYALGRPISVEFSAFMWLGNPGLYGSATALCNLYGDLSSLSTAGQDALPQYGGIQLGLKGYASNIYPVLAINNTVVQTAPAVGIETLYHFFMDVTPVSGGYKIDWSYNTTGVKPSTPMYTYTASSITSHSNSLAFTGSSSPANMGYNGGYVDNLQVTLY
jgi:hypothetical protein